MSAAFRRQFLLAAAIVAGLVALEPLQDFGSGVWNELTSPSPSTPALHRDE